MKVRVKVGWRALSALLFVAPVTAADADAADTPPAPGDILYPAGVAPSDTQPSPESRGRGSASEEPGPKNDDPGNAWGTALLYLGVLAGGCAAYVKLGGRLPAGPWRRSRRETGGQSLVVAETRMLGNRQFLMVVEYEDQRMLLGVGPGLIHYLCPLGNEGAGPGSAPGSAPAPAPAAGVSAAPLPADLRRALS